MSTELKVGLCWFQNDLRLHDQRSLMQAAREVDRLLCVFVIEPYWFQVNRYEILGVSDKRLCFMYQSLIELNQKLSKLGQNLLIIEKPGLGALNQLIAEHSITDLYTSYNAGWSERQLQKLVKQQNENVRFHCHHTHTLFSKNELPFELDNLPKTFTEFRKLIERQTPRKAIQAPSYLPPPVISNIKFPDWGMSMSGLVQGGETSALIHCDKYFATELPLNYKQVRNALDGWSNSTKFSFWLANGSLSVVELGEQLNVFEHAKGANESTHWIYFELLWREYFQWYAHKFNRRLFAFNGIKSTKPLTSFYATRFKQWTNSTTPYPIVNAAMNELRQTGYISNRLRQIVASCLVNELSIDWRYGAAYFEQQLIDYDVASNWANWQYIAGVGADTRDKRHFNLQKQTEIFDPDHRYIKQWQGDEVAISIDVVDAADWPILEPSKS